MMEFLTDNLVIFWLVLGGMFILLEALALPGVGFLFAGLGAITVGGLLVFDVVDPDFINTSTYFFIASAAWAALLWIPLNRYLKLGKDSQFSSIKGQEVEVIENDIVKPKTGKVKWSGTVMQAKISKDSKIKKIAVGETATVVASQGSILLLDVEAE